MTSYEIWLSDSFGNRLTQAVDFEYAEFALVANNYAAFSVRFPGQFDKKYLRKDNIVECWRNNRLVTAGFMRTFRTQTDANGRKTRTSGGYDGNYLLTSRIVAYYAGSAQSSKSGFSDDIMKEIVRENIGSSSTDTTRDRTSSGFYVTANASAAQTITRAFAYDNVLKTMQSLAENSRQLGTDLYFGVTPVVLASGGLGWRFYTAINQPGADRRVGVVDNAVVFSDQRGQIDRPDYEEDYTDEATWALAAGQGEGIDRATESASADGINFTPWSRREVIAEARMDSSTDALLDKARERINSARGVRRFTGTLLDTPYSRYDIDWGFGDRITVDYDDKQFDAIVKSVHIKVDKGGETITGGIEVVE